MTTPVAIIRRNGEGDTRWFYGGGVHTWKATSDETDGALLAFEDMVAEGKTTPLHLHPEADEALYVLEGEILVHIDGMQHRLEAGGFSFAPRGVAHAFVVVTPSARLLTLQTPGTGDAFFRDASEPLAQTAVTGPIDFAKVGHAAHATGATVILGAAPFDLGG